MSSMACPACGLQTETLDTRPIKKGQMLRRRRECVGCGQRCTTYEVQSGILAEVEERNEALKKYIETLPLLKKLRPRAP